MTASMKPNDLVKQRAGQQLSKTNQILNQIYIQMVRVGWREDCAETLQGDDLMRQADGEWDMDIAFLYIAILFSV